MKESARRRRCQKNANGLRTAGFSEDGNVTGITAEICNVVSNPAERLYLVQCGVVSGTELGIFGDERLVCEERE